MFARLRSTDTFFQKTLRKIIENIAYTIIDPNYFIVLNKIFVKLSDISFSSLNRKRKLRKQI